MIVVGSLNRRAGIPSEDIEEADIQQPQQLSPKDRRCEYVRAWLAANREHLREYLRSWKAKHHDRVRIHREREYKCRRSRRRRLRLRREAQRRRPELTRGATAQRDSEISRTSNN